MNYRFLLPLFLCFFYFKSFAELSLNITQWNEASILAKALPNFLIKYKIEQIGNLNLKELVEKIEEKQTVIIEDKQAVIKEITFMSVFDSNKQIFLGGKWINPINELVRIGATCYTAEASKEIFEDPIKQIGSKRIVIINKESPLYQNLETYYLHVTLLHEVLCSFYGFKVDDQYQITSSIVFILSLLNEPEQLDEYLNKNKWNFLDPFKKVNDIAAHHEYKLLNRKYRLPADDGGVTVGPGSGDPWSGHLKFILMSKLHKMEQFCKNPDNHQEISNLSCVDFLKKMQLYWDKLRLLNIETEDVPLVSINVLDGPLKINRYRINNNSDSSFSLVFNRAYLKMVDSELKDKEIKEKAQKRFDIVSDAFFDLITNWNRENEKNK